MPAAPDVLSEAGAAAFLGISVVQLQRLRVDGQGPPVHMSTFQPVAYHRAEVESWALLTAQQWRAAIGQVLETPAAGGSRAGRVAASRRTARVGLVRVGFAPSTKSWILR